MTKPVDRAKVNLSQGHGHVINRSAGGMLLLLPQQAHKRQVVEMHVPSEANTKLVEVCWTRSIPISARAAMCLAGVRFLFDVPAPGQAPQVR